MTDVDHGEVVDAEKPIAVERGECLLVEHLLDLSATVYCISPVTGRPRRTLRLSLATRGLPAAADPTTFLLVTVIDIYPVNG